ncbi:hypothetical protein GH714_021068 [Hevea brasiliensis]|uniref:Uncharacterized protein n=1 Tax=Hevea brasiliensis TaxID=3981 RepID=A0A6A6K844_HEVBR|nr:hypothetical protein GH714_021068 [Hevea brasiliensis]
MSDLRSIRSSPYLHTLNPPQRIVIDKYLVRDNGNVSESILLDGVRISVPDLFLGSAIAVHGLEGILVAEVGSNSREEHIGDSPSLSPVAAWSELNAPASSPTVEMGLRGPLSPDSWSEKRNGRRGHRTGNQRGFHDDLSNQSGQNHFAKYSRQFDSFP